MGLQLKKQRDGKKLRPFWYGCYTDSEGKRRVINLNVKWKGNPPASLKVADIGDAAFERSRDAAQLELDRHVEEAASKGRAEHLTEKLIRSKTGSDVAYVRLDELSDKWRNLPRDYETSKRYLRDCDAVFKRFIEFMRQRRPKAAYLYEVTRDDVSAFRNELRETLAPSTLRRYMTMLKKSFEYFLPPGSLVPFASFSGRSKKSGGDTISRKPFSVDELKLLLDAASRDEFMYPLIVCAAMTGMRQGDVCNLRWEDIDLEEGMLKVKTAKTEADIEIPVFPPLRAVLESSGVRDSGYVWPEAVEVYEKRSGLLTTRFKKIVVEALSAENAESVGASSEEIERDGIAAIEKNYKDRRRARMSEALRMYLAGGDIVSISEKLGAAKSTISSDLHKVEDMIGVRFMRNQPGGKTLREKMSITRVERSKGKRSASVWDWHSLRTTWITLALSGGVPEMTVRLVSGHTTYELVLKHYYKPNREQMRRNFSRMLPEVFTGGNDEEADPVSEMQEIMARMKNNQATEGDRRRLRLLSAKI